MEEKIQFIKYVDEAISLLKLAKTPLLKAWVALNKKEVPELSHDEAIKIMVIIETVISKDDLLAAWEEDQGTPASSRSNYQKDYQARRKAILSKLLV